MSTMDKQKLQSHFMILGVVSPKWDPSLPKFYAFMLKKKINKNKIRKIVTSL